MNENADFQSGDVVCLKNDLAQKSPIVVSSVSIFTPQSFFNFVTGETEPPDDPTPYWLIHCVWLNSQRKKEHASFRQELLVKKEISG